MTFPNSLQNFRKSEKRIMFFTMIMVDVEGAGIKLPPPSGLGCIREGTAGRVNCPIVGNWQLIPVSHPIVDVTFFMHGNVNWKIAVHMILPEMSWAVHQPQQSSWYHHHQLFYFSVFWLFWEPSSLLLVLFQTGQCFLNFPPPFFSKICFPFEPLQ